MQRQQKTGFTLIELLVVIAIIGILAGLISANLSGARSRARDAERKSDLKSIQTAIELAYEQSGVLPGLVAGTDMYSSATPAGSDPASVGEWIPSLAPRYISRVPRDPKDRDGYAYSYRLGQDVQEGAYYLEARLENSEVPSLATAPPISSTDAGAFVTGTYTKSSQSYLRLSSGPAASP